MADGDMPRKIDLSLPANYFSKPMTRVRDWLEKNTNSLRAVAEPQIVLRIRGALGSEISVLNDGDISALVRSWAEDHGFRLVTPPGPPPGIKESELKARLARLFGAIPTEINCDWGSGRGTISVSGLTAKLYAGKMQYSISRSWGGDLQFKTQAPGAVFAASLSSEKWSLTFTMGKLAPSISDLESVFKKGQAALIGAVGEIPNIDWSSVSKTKEKFAPYLDPIKSAVDAVSKTAALKPGDVSFGAWIEGGVPGGKAQGVTGGLRLTILF